ncbi:MAG: FAD-linked oxidase C-terminal domain-containing protein [Pseudonocardiaceae bacterium]
MPKEGSLASDYRSRCHDLYGDAIQIIGKDNVRADSTTNVLHSYDASLEQGQPDLVVAPHNTEELRALVAATHRHRVPFVMRGAGTGYSGGALPARGGVVILTAGLDRILEADFDDGFIRCEPGVVLATVHRLAEDAGWLYLPDPSSHQVCTIGGNVAENAGGPHALGGGPTSNYVSAVDLIRPDGSIHTLHEQQPWDGDLDLRSVVVGSEGTLGAVSSVTLRLVRKPERAQVVLGTFAHQEDALGAVTDVFDIGLLPSAMDMLTGAFIPSRRDFSDPSLLFVGLQGRREEVAAQADQLEQCVGRNRGIYELLDVPEFLQRRAELVRDKVRRMVAASGCPRYYLFDAVAPRSNLAPLMSSIRQAAEDFGLPVLNTFHAGDGNVHPTPFYDPAHSGHQDQLRAFSSQILTECRKMGGALSGEHGVGLEKRTLMPEFFEPAVLTIMRRIKDAFDPDDLSNPEKIFPNMSVSGNESSPRSAPRVRVSPTPARPRLNRIDALIDIDDPRATFADLDCVLVDSPYELPYEPLGGVPGQPILDAIDAGAPSLREAGPARARDLILGVDLQRDDEELTVALGGTVAKDVAGYELRKLVYGGRGRLGTLLRARLRLVPRTSDSQLIQTDPRPIDDTIALCRRLHAADLPFSYLGVLLGTDGTTTVTGRLEIRGGTLDRHVARLRAVAPDLHFQVTGDDRWNDPAMHALAAGDMPLMGLAGLPWNQNTSLHNLADQRLAAFASVGHRRTWWRGTPLEQAECSPLTIATVAAFGVAL